MVYAKVDLNDEIIRTGPCPKNTTFVSNFRLLTDEQKKEHGWYKVTTDTTAIQPWQSIRKSNYALVNDEVIETKEIVDLDLAVYKDKKKQELKQTHIIMTKEGFTCTNEIKIDIDANSNIGWIALKDQILHKGLEDADIQIRDFYNTTHTVKGHEFLDMWDEGFVYYNSILSKKWEYQTLIDSYQTHQLVHDFYWRKAIYDENEEFTGYEYWCE